MMLAVAGVMQSQTPVSATAVTDNGQRVDIEVNPGLDSLRIGSREALIAEAWLTDGRDSLPIGSAGVYGRVRYIQQKRGNNSKMPVPATIMQAGHVPQGFTLKTSANYEPWMQDATVAVRTTLYGCAACTKGQPQQTLMAIEIPQLQRNTFEVLCDFVAPAAERVKTRTLSGRANVEFAVNRTELVEDFRGNYAQLSAVRASIDSVRNDADVTVDSISITGYASPEGTYANNARLARGRTDALARYVASLYQFPKGFVSTGSVAEDWQGLLGWLRRSNLPNRDGIEAIITDASITDADVREQKIRSQYPEEYDLLLRTVYPSLRHTDYRIAYTVRSFNDPAEILEVMRTNPAKLSLNELFVAAQSLEPGSDDFNEVFEVAVRLYPDSEVANLNAANAALRRGDTRRAAELLKKAGDSPEANCLRQTLNAQR